MTTDETLRRWTPVIARIKARLANRNGSTPPKLEAALDEAATTFDVLLQDLAGAETANRNLRSRITSLESQWDDLFQRMPVACVVTDASGAIRRANDRAADLLNTSARHLQRENGSLTYFVQDRQRFFALLKTLGTGGETFATLPVRPRERAPMIIDMSAVPHLADEELLWLWFLVPGSPQRESRKALSADVRERRGDGLVAEASSGRADLVDEAS
jgi:PAS domain-containing protein